MIDPSDDNGRHPVDAGVAASVLFFLALTCMAFSLTLFLTPSPCWTVFMVVAAVLVAAGVAWRLRYQGWGIKLPERSPRQLIAVGGVGLLLWIIGMIVGSTVDLRVSVAALVLLGLTTVLLLATGLTARRATGCQ